jgi:hypothetical protein
MRYPPLPIRGQRGPCWSGRCARLRIRYWPVGEKDDARVERGRPDQVHPDPAAVEARSPLPQTVGLTQRWISSASPCLAGSWASSPQPKEIRFPRCRALMLVTLSASSPLINDAFHSRGSSRVREATYLGTRLTRSAKPVSSVMVGQTLAGPSYRPCARAGMRPRPGAKSNSYRSPSPSRIAHRSGEGPMTPSRVMWVEMITFPWDLHSRARSVAGPAENLRLARTT